MSEAELWAEIGRLKARLGELSTREGIATVKPWAPQAGGVVYIDGAGTGALTTETAFQYDDVNNELIVPRLRLTEQATPSTPVNPFATLFANSTGIFSGVNDAGTVYQMVRYEEGVFTPTLSGAGTAGTFTYDATTTGCEYTRIGDRCFFNGRLEITATSVAPTGNITINALPFTSGANNNDNGNILGTVTISWAGFNLVAGYTKVTGIVLGGATNFRLYEDGDNLTRAVVQGSELGSVVSLFMAGSYKIA